MNLDAGIGSAGQCAERSALCIPPPRRTGPRQTRKGSFTACEAYTDFCEWLAQDGIDAVLIATPDHWHAIPAILAARAGKDIYCEKPLAVCIGQGRAMAQAVREHQVVFQTGSQQRTEFGGLFRDACELVRNGRIGQVKTIRVGVGPPPVRCDLGEEPVPEGTDWNLWLGPAPWRGYNEVLCPKGVHHHFPAWRNYREYAGGGLADMGAHHFDIAQWALDMDTSGPVRIDPPEGDAMAGLEFTYAAGVEMYHGGPRGCTFEGTEGTIYVDRGTLVLPSLALYRYWAAGQFYGVELPEQKIKSDLVTTADQFVSPTRTYRRRSA